ncbi:MAG: LON peptidase substrate-binding domain-containing protein [Gammaproteobacteria bacterium]|jgi:Lon protease-like protein|nr:LON peptidase substrate-binding domain-containing protein [Gammaproteobacteria bacterium]|tara:strand:+ start:3108 stop:3680 length:573 start_codon:yes stop_codon:yes gene_type:complete
MTIGTVPLFPLKTVLFPGGILPLRIFEPRYLTMVSECLREKNEFGVLLIKEEADVRTYEIGTIAEIVDWDQGSDGLLGISAEGGKRFQLESAEKRTDGLYIASVQDIPDEPEVPVPNKYQFMVRLIKNVFDVLGTQDQITYKNYDNSAWVGYRLAEILPLTLMAKQQLLELNDPLERLSLLKNHIQKELK